MTSSAIALNMFRSFLNPLIRSSAANFEVTIVLFQPAWRSAFTSTMCDPLDTFTGSTFRKMVVFG